VEPEDGSVLGRVAVLLAVLVLAGARSAGAEGEAHGAADHSDPFAFVVLGLAAVMTVATIGRWLAGRFRQPPVLGELLIGLVVGNVGYWLGQPIFVLIMHLGDARPVFREVWRSGEAVSDVTARVHGIECHSALAPAGVNAVQPGMLVREITRESGL